MCGASYPARRPGLGEQSLQQHGARRPGCALLARQALLAPTHRHAPLLHTRTDEYSNEVQDLGFHIPLKEGWEITLKALQVLRDLQPRLRALLGPLQDGLLLLDSKELQDASEADLQAVTTAATILISKGAGEEGALAASRSLVSAEPLKPGHVAYDDTRTSFGLFAKVRTWSAVGNRRLLRLLRYAPSCLLPQTDLPALTPICMYGGRVTTVEESDAEQNKQLQPQPGRQGHPIVCAHDVEGPKISAPPC